MSNTRFLDILGQAKDDNGDPLPGAKLYFYASGTSTAKDTYSDAGLTTPNANPVVADAAGRFPDVFLESGAYKVVLQTSAGVVIDTHDPVQADVVTTSAFMQTLLEATSATAALTDLGVSSFMQGVLDDTDAAAAQGSLGLVGTAAWRNVLLNPDFRVHQRKTASVTSSNFVADRWLVEAQGGSRTVQRFSLSDADRTAIGREDAMYGVEYAATGGSSTSDREILCQRVESARTLAGQTATLSFWAKRTSGTGDMAANLVQVFGTGGSPSTSISAGATKLTLSSSWQRISFSVAIPAVTGKTFGSNEDDYLSVRLWFSAESTFNDQTGSLGVQTITVQIADVVLEPGASRNAFVARPMSFEMPACMRYFETSTPGGVYTTFTAQDGSASGMSHPTALYRQLITFRVPKRAAPTVTTYDQVGTGSSFSYDTGTYQNGGSWTVGPNALAGGFAVGHNIASSTETQFTWQASAEL